MAARRQASALKGLASCVIVIRDDALFDERDFDGFDRVVRLPIRPLRRKPEAVLFYLPRLLRAARLLARALIEADCTRLQMNDFYLLEGVFARLFGYRGEIFTWVRMDPHRLGRAISGLYLALAKRYSSSIVAVSTFIASRLEPAIQATVLHDPAPELSLVSPPQERRLVFIGNYVRGKGQDLAIRAFARVTEDYPDAELLFYGGDLGLRSNRLYLDGLKELVRRLSLCDRVRFGPFMADSSKALDGAVAALVLSCSESFSLTCLEASASGVAVIATRCGGPEEIIVPGKTGWLIKVGDEQAAVAAMMEALGAPERASEMGRMGAALVRQRFSRESFAASLTSLFHLSLGNIQN